MKVLLTDKFCERAKPGEWFDEKATGLALLVGKHRKTWQLHYSHSGKRSRLSLGHYPSMSLAAARARTVEGKGKVEAGEPIVADTVGAMLAHFQTRYANGLRSADYVRDVIDRLVRPEIGGLALDEIRRSHVARMLDKIADTNGPVMADRTLAIVRKAFNWHSARDDHFVIPIAKGMARTKPADRQRDRVLTDAEVRLIWSAGDGVFARYVRFLLLTAVRRSEASEAHAREIAEGVWTIPAERMKGKQEFVVPLSAEALTVSAQSCRGYLFSTDGGATPISGFSKFKAALDRASGVADWTLHDLRRTGRSLMSRAGVSPDIAERCLAHKIGGVRGVYDRYAYLEEKRDALAKLAALIASITGSHAPAV